MVAGGDFLVQLDSTAFEKELEQQNISLANAETGVIQAASNLETAKATKKEYIEGTFKQEQMKIENEINKAENDIISADIDLQVALAQNKPNKTSFAQGYLTHHEPHTSHTQIPCHAARNTQHPKTSREKSPRPALSKVRRDAARCAAPVETRDVYAYFSTRLFGRNGIS